MALIVDPLVSVYLPTHNRSELLARALNSLLAQTYKNIEILVCSDGSTDNTNQLMEEYCQRHQNIRFIQNDTPQGACVARNRCIELAKGDYITGLDDDDIFHPRRIELLLKYFDEKYSFICSQGLEKDLAVEKVDFEMTNLKEESEQIIDLTLLLNENIIGNQILTRTERIKGISGFDENMPAWQDYDTWVRLVEKYGPGKKIFKQLYYCDIDHRRPRISISSNRFLGCHRFYTKHEHLLTSSQKKNAKIRQSIIGGEYLTAFQLLKLFNFNQMKFWLKAWSLKLGLEKR